jgi:hypothetical protein
MHRNNFGVSKNGVCSKYGYVNRENDESPLERMRFSSKFSGAKTHLKGPDSHPVFRVETG